MEIIYSIYDKKTCVYDHPVVALTRDHAIRLVDATVRYWIDNPSLRYPARQIADYPDDYAVYLIAHIDRDGECNIIPLDGRELIIEVAQLPCFISQKQKENHHAST